MEREWEGERVAPPRAALLDELPPANRRCGKRNYLMQRQLAPLTPACGLSDGIERSVNGARIGTLWEARGRLLRLFEPTKREWNCSERRWRAFRREPAQERSV